MRTLRFKIFFYLLIIISSSLFSQEIKNIQFEQDGKTIIIHYDLIDKANQEYNIRIYQKKDKENTWGSPLKHVSGDIGKGQTPSINKTVFWDVLSEKEKLVGNIKFKITAEPLRYEKATSNTIPGKYPQASERLLSSNDLRYLSKWELSIMRNEIFARHGYKFQKNPSIIKYFVNLDWYNNIPEVSTNSGYIFKYYLSEIEKKNIEIIKKYERY
ncbi:YARHG domain-containing protein [Bacteroidota bacterium]